MPKLNKAQAKLVDEAEAMDFPLLDVGDYMASLNSVESRQGQAGEYWVWEFAVSGDEEGNDLANPIKLWENTSLSEKAAFRLKAMFEAFQVPPDTDTDEILGEWVIVSVGQEVQKQGANAGKLRNVFLSARPIDGEEE